MSNGVLLYEGPSELDGAPIVAIATGLSRPSINRKTGPMVQVWILRQDMHPAEAARSGADVSICGDCPHRPANWGSCYVTIGQAPAQVWKQYRAGRYPAPGPQHLAQLRRSAVRLSAYGDPAAVPLQVWAQFVGEAPLVTGYTHQWRAEPMQELRRFLMASVDSEAERQEALALGWRTFRVKRPGEQLLPREYLCPADPSVGRTCLTCRSCDGNPKDRAGVATPVINVHGSHATRFQLPVLN